MDSFIPLTILASPEICLAGMWLTEPLSALLLPDRDNERFHLFEELQKLAQDEAFLGPAASSSAEGQKMPASCRR